MTIRQATIDDFDALWRVIKPIVRAGDTYAYDPQISRSDAEKLWVLIPRATYLYEQQGEVLGTYYIKTNQAGNGDHVCNCGYMVSAAAQGRGIATRLCEHSQTIAREMGYQAMQFNFVVATNTGAVRLWRKLGFATVGTLPKAFRHPTLGLVDALVMSKWL